MGTRSLSSTKFQLKLTGSLQNQLIDSSIVAITQPNFSVGFAIQDGLSAAQANRAWQYSGTLAVGDIFVLDLSAMSGVDIGAGSGKDALGQTVDFENIVAIIIQNNNDYGNIGQLEIYPSNQQGWTPIGSHTVSNGGALKSQGILMKIQPEDGGFDVTTVSKHRVTLHAVSADVSYVVSIVARNDDNESSSSSSSTSSSSISTSSSSISTSSSSQSLSESSQSSQSSQSSNSSSSSSQSSSSLSRSI